MKKIFAYDFDGVVSIGIFPRNENDIIITGRSIEEKETVLCYLKKNKIKSNVYFNNISLKNRGNHSLKSRLCSGKHKSETIKNIKKDGIIVERFFEDDAIQLEVIKKNHPKLDVVYIISRTRK